MLKTTLAAAAAAAVSESGHIHRGSPVTTICDDSFFCAVPGKEKTKKNDFSAEK